MAKKNAKARSPHSDKFRTMKRTMSQPKDTTSQSGTVDVNKTLQEIRAIAAGSRSGRNMQPLSNKKLEEELSKSRRQASSPEDAWPEFDRR